MATYRGRRHAGAVFASVGLVIAVVGTLLVAGGSPADACDPPYIVDEETGEFDQEAWDAGVEECAEWVREMEGGTARRAATLIGVGALTAGAAAVWWWRRRRSASSQEPGDPSARSAPRG
jgi:hypothetical protein